ncbi:MAG: hypothetical protein LBU32_22975 [Clostridiales bacterium]|nr:hypothetical protein [Clostridiales bacterium]
MPLATSRSLVSAAELFKRRQLGTEPESCRAPKLTAAECADDRGNSGGPIHPSIFRSNAATEKAKWRLGVGCRRARRKPASGAISAGAISPGGSRNRWVFARRRPSMFAGSLCACLPDEDLDYSSN